jgi:putative peptide zinc metalloprotease protein
VSSGAVAATAGALQLRRRSDLHAVRHIYRNQSCWVLKDPLGLQFYRLNDEEYALLMMLDGRTTLSEMVERFNRLFAPQRVTALEIQNLLVDFHRKGITISTGRNQGRVLYHQARERVWKKTKETLSNVLAIRWRGIDPDRMLTLTVDYVGWLFAPWAVRAMGLLMLAAVLLLAVHNREFVARLPQLEQFLSQGNWPLLFAVVIVTKILHELGHAYSFKRFGGECHEIGIMLMFFIPTLYCNTTDAWLLKNRWQRAAIGMAGGYVELIIASLATFGWWFSQPGVFQMLCLDLMIVCSVSAVAINGNPLLRYDGYYVLSDLLELPNLYERSGQVLHDWFMTVVLGIPKDSEPESSRGTKALLIIYRIGATLNRLLILYYISFALASALGSVGLRSIAIILLCSSLVGIAAQPAIKLYSSFLKPGSFRSINLVRFLLFTSAVFVVGAWIVFWPLPHYVHGSCIVRATGAGAVYTLHEGILEEVYVRAGEQVRFGDPLIRMSNVDLSLQVGQKEAELNKLRADYATTTLARHSKLASASELVTLAATIRKLEADVGELRNLERKLLLCAPRDGVVVPGQRFENDNNESHALARQEGTIFDERNLLRSLPRGQHVCDIANLGELEAVVSVEQYDVAYLARGQHVRIWLESFADGTLFGSLTTISRKPQTATVKGRLRDISDAGDTIQQDITRRFAVASSRNLITSYEAGAMFHEPLAVLAVGTHGKARIEVGTWTLLERCINFLYRTFRIKL